MLQKSPGIIIYEWRSNYSPDFLSKKKKMPKNILLVLPAALLIALTVFSCSGGDAEEENGNPENTGLQDSLLERPADPVVLVGNDVAALIGSDPDGIVAFSHVDSWRQVPVQVDERKLADFSDIYNHVYFTIRGITTLVYADPSTLAGPDDDPTFDEDDEIVFMARDAGGKPSKFTCPPGVDPGSGVEVRIFEADNIEKEGYLYLFTNDGSLDPAAGEKYGTYDFSLDAGDYPEDFNFSNGPNPEDSWFTSTYYERHFSDRWISDVLKIKAPEASGVDILDMHKDLFAPGVCARSVASFSNGEGAFVANIDGPVRSIRSYIGANSGPLTQRRHLFYDRREDISTILRVHAIPSMLDFFDYSADAVGMTYRNDLNREGVTIDGVPDEVSDGEPSWELVSGAPGSLVVASLILTNIEDMEISCYYVDEETPELAQCTGDDSSYGASGLIITSPFPSTDPIFAVREYFEGIRFLYYESPDLSVDEAEKLSGFATRPLETEAAPISADR